MNQSFKVTTNIGVKEEFEFALYHTYTGFAGYSGILMSICALVAFFNTFGRVTMFTSLVLLFCALLFIVVKPLTLFIHAKKKIKEDEKVGKINYIFDDVMFTASQDNRSMTVYYNKLYRVRECCYSILIYTEKKHAMIIPKKDLGNHYEALKKLMREKARNASVRLRK